MPEKSVENLLKEKKIYQIVNPKCVQVAPSISTREAIEIMQKYRSGYCIVAEGRKLLGIFTEVDLIQRVLGVKADVSAPINRYMTSDVQTLTPDNSVGDAIDSMGKHRFYHLPLVNAENELVGILSVRTLIRFLAAYYPTEIYNLPPTFDQIMGTPEGG